MPYPGQPKDTSIPSHLDRWNWGAFILNIVWGIGNGVFSAFWALVPIYGFYVIYRLGKDGNKLAWRNRLWENEEHFVRTQRAWSRAGLVFLCVTFSFMIAVASLIAFVVFPTFYNHEAYRLSVERLQNSPQVIEITGTPLSAGMPMPAQIVRSGSSEYARFEFRISGPMCSGRAVSRASKMNDAWKMSHLVAHLECSPKPIILENGPDRDGKNIH